MMVAMTLGLTGCGKTTGSAPVAAAPVVDLAGGLASAPSTNDAELASQLAAAAAEEEEARLAALELQRQEAGEAERQRQEQEAGIAAASAEQARRAESARRREDIREADRAERLEAALAAARERRKSRLAPDGLLGMDSGLDPAAAPGGDRQDFVEADRAADEAEAEVQRAENRLRSAEVELRRQRNHLATLPRGTHPGSPPGFSLNPYADRHYDDRLAAYHAVRASYQAQERVVQQQVDRVGDLRREWEASREAAVEAAQEREQLLGAADPDPKS